MDDFRQEGLAAIGHVDDLAKQAAKVMPPDMVVDAMAHAAAYLVFDTVSSTDRIKFVVAMLKNIYRAGYVAGRDDPIAEPIRSGNVG